MKDVLQDFAKPIYESPLNFYYLHNKLLKNLRVLKSLFKDIKKGFEIFRDGVKLVSTGTCWVYHCIQSMVRVIDKFRLYTCHFKDSNAKEKNCKVKVTVQGKVKKLLDSQVILESAFLKDVLTSAKIFCLVTRNKDRNIVETVESFERTKNNYKRLLK